MLRTHSFLSTWTQKRSMKWLGILGLVALSECLVIIPLTKMKTMRETLREKNLLTNFLLRNNDDRSQNVAHDPKLSLHPLRNYLDVSVLGGWHSTAPPGVGSKPQPSTNGTQIPVAAWSNYLRSTQGTARPQFFSAVLVASPSQPSPSPTSQTFMWEHSPLPQIGKLVDVVQPFALSKAQFGLEHAPFDGILGLGYRSLAIQGTTPVFDNLKRRGVISQSVFAFYLSTQKENGSIVMLGGVDNSYHKGKLQWIPVSRPHYWQITMNRITMNGVVFGCVRGCQAILDTGTSFVLGPSRLVTAIQMLISASPVGHEYAVSCSYVARLPTIIFSINGNDYPVPPQAYIRKNLQGQCLSNFGGGTENMSHSETWILGDVFLRLYFSVYDRENNRVGLAPAV
ncbi:hypothetical protein DBR06_SOUSAS6910013 [Sousa chinensis]|nr:hypothetical protein DBR06_SOUSAS6910013 [Sousa chinensis]